jgi:putative membrane protein
MLQQKFDYLVLLPSFLAYFGSALALTLVFLAVYTFITPVKEWTEIRNGNAAAAVSVSGALLGFALALASVITNSRSLIDMTAWGGVALVAQLVAFGAVRLAKPDLVVRIADRSMSHAILLAAVSVAVGILNAACMTY